MIKSIIFGLSLQCVKSAIYMLKNKYRFQNMQYIFDYLKSRNNLCASSNLITVPHDYDVDGYIIK